MNRAFSLLILLLLTISAGAKQSMNCSHADRYGKKRSNTKATIASPLLEQYDVTHLKLDLQMSNLNTAVSGNAITTAKVVDAAGMSSYVFELNDSLTID